MSHTYFKRMKYLNLILTTLVALTAVTGDHLVFDSPYSDSHVFRGVADNFVHAAIGFLSSLLFLTYDASHTMHEIAMNVSVCTAVSSLIDLDHVIVAGSIYWKDLKNFKHRGIFHCSSVCFGASIVVIVAGVISKRLDCTVLGWMLLIAFTSHHVRDGNRRGLWVWPCGHTRPLSTAVYVLLVAVLPSVYHLLYRHTKPDIIKYAMMEHYVV